MTLGGRPFIPPLPSAKSSSSTDKENATNTQIVEAGPGTEKPCPAVASQALRRSRPPDRVAFGLTQPTRYIDSGENEMAAETNLRSAGSEKLLVTADRIDLTSLSRSGSASATATKTPARAATRNTSRRVVRYGETVESLFCLRKDSSKEHRDLCNEIANGDKGDDPKSWRKALQMAAVSLAAKGSSASDNEGRDLIRLHRRATTRFPIRFGSTEVVGKREEATDILAVWLLFAQVQSEYGPRSEARQTYQRILTLSKGQDVDDVSLYLAIADFECVEDKSHVGVEKAMRLIEMGIERGVEPTEALKIRLRELEQTNSQKASKHSSGRSFPSLPKRSRQPLRLRRKVDLSEGKALDDEIVPQSPQGCDVYDIEKKGERQSQCSKNLTSSVAVGMECEDNSEETGVVVTFTERPGIDIREGIDQWYGSDNDVTSVGASEPKNPGHRPGEDDQTSGNKTDDETVAIPPGQQVPLLSSTERLLSGTMTKDSSIVHTKKRTECNETMARDMDKNPSPTSKFLSMSRDSKTPAVVARKRASALSSGRTSLSRQRLGGGAMRVDAVAAEILTSEEEKEHTVEAAACHNNGKRKKQRIEEGQGEDFISKPEPIPKITRTDLTYMLNWDPMASRKKARNADDYDDNSGNMNSAPSCADATGRSSEGIDEKSEDSIVTFTKQTSSTTSTKSIDRTVGQTNSSREGRSTNISCDGPPEKLHKHKQDVTPMNENSTATPTSFSSLSPEELAMVAKSNKNFLPLVSEDNMLRVNSVPYAKLGVIGKGGSCKVYRALSQECNVLAIKKVKLAGMDKKAVSGYANEIKLLKRLRGSPAIIQLFDSEVDLKRKAIFLVMELGEIDLNHVIQQQVLDGELKAESSRKKNMNFIRLTWQHMLSAVQCIHEERIIHGDLKPANFLFVRGTLKLIDFGIAKAIQTDDTTNIYRDSQIGTLNYMSPEAILDTGTGKDGARMRCGKPSDVWALGCILYQMCYGRTPFAELHVIQKLQAIVNPRHKINYPAIIDDAAVDAIQLCLKRKPEDRAPIIGKNGLLNEHWFLHSKRKSDSVS